jgi:hypothetical protein
MNKIRMVIRELHRAERKLAGQLRRMADRHQTDQEVYHLARDLAGWSQQHVSELARVGRRYGVNLPSEVDGGARAVGTARRRTSRLVGRRSAPTLLLLADLRQVYRNAAGVSLDWELLAQAAQASREQELLALATQCHPDTLRQTRWANAKLKEIAGHALASR